MRVAVVVTYFPSVSQTFVLAQVSGLLARGHDVDVFALGAEPPPNGLEQPPAVPEALAGHVHYQPPTPMSALVRAARLPAVIAREWRGHWRAAARAARRGRPAPVCALYEGAPFVGRGAYDALLCHFGPNGERALRVRDAGLVSGRVVTAMHGADMSRHIATHGPGVYRKLFARGDLFLPVSAVWRDRLIALGCDPARIVVHRMGVALRAFPFAPPRPPAADEPVRLLCIARLVEKKGIEYAVQAVARLRADGVPVVLDVIGDGPLRGSLLRLVHDLGLPNAVRIVGARTGADVARSLRAAHVFVVPSVTAADGDMEGIPVALMEAMASGVPVVATWHSGIPELVRHGTSGLLVPERDPGALAGAIQRLVDRPEQWPVLARAARETIVRDYDVERLNDRLVELLAGWQPASRAHRVAPRVAVAGGSRVPYQPPPDRPPVAPTA